MFFLRDSGGKKIFFFKCASNLNAVFTLMPAASSEEGEESDT